MIRELKLSLIMFSLAVSGMALAQNIAVVNGRPITK